MFTIPTANSIDKNSITNIVDYSALLIANNIEFEKVDSFDNIEELKKYFTNIHNFDETVLSKEKLDILLNETIPALNNIFSVEVAKERIKLTIVEITTLLLSKLNGHILTLELSYSNYGAKIKHIDNILLKAKEEITTLLNHTNDTYKDFKAKEMLLQSNQEYLAKSFGGKLFLNHSVESVLTLLNTVLEHTFAADELHKGRTVAKDLNFATVNSAIKYFISKADVMKIDTEEGLNIDADSFHKSFKELPKLLNSTISGIIEWITSLHTPSPNTQPDSPATHVNKFDNFTKQVMMAWSRANDIANSDIKPLLEETSNTKLLPLLDICKNVDELYREIRDMDKNDERYSNNLEIIKKYLKLLSIGTRSAYFDLECRAYDVLRYISHLDYFLFLKNLCVVMYVTFANKLKKDLDSNAPVQPLPEDAAKQDQEAQSMVEEKEGENNEESESNVEGVQKSDPEEKGEESKTDSQGEDGNSGDLLENNLDEDPEEGLINDTK